eukprot:7115340-Pyramimonas_sp.AAC.1
MASMMAQDSGIWVKIASDTRPRGLQTAPDGFKCPGRPPRTLSRGQNHSKNEGKSMLFVFSLFRRRWALEASRWPQDGPR